MAGGGRDRGGDDGGRSQGWARSRRSQAGTQTTARTMAQGRFEGGRSHGGGLADNSRGTTDGDEASQGGDPGGVEEPMRPHNIDGSGDWGGAAATNIRGEASVLEDWGQSAKVAKVKPEGRRSPVEP